MIRRSRLAAVLLAASCLVAACAQPSGRTSDCPQSASDLPIQSIYGQWEARIEGQDGTATMVLARHPEYEGVRGSVQRAGLALAQLAGDIDPEGQLALDESQDGKSISASWSGTLKPDSCGREFTGSWYRSSDDSHHPFVLRKSNALK